jgi:hydroxymethylglutaryl-CoA lyase
LEVGFPCWDYSIPSLEAYSEELLQFGDLENLTQVKQPDTTLRFDPQIKNVNRIGLRVTMNIVKIIECPRDAWQGLPKNMPAEVKADYLRVLIAAGFKHIDAVSFVSRSAVPQMADSELVLEYLDPPDDVEIIGIVVNAKGAERAVKTGSVQTLGFPYSVSPTFLQRNQSQTPEESLDELEKIGTLAYKAGMDVVAYISMAFGNPYGEAWGIDEVVAACDLLTDNGVTQISLADTVGLATPKQVNDLVADVLAVHDGIEIGVHLHARADQAAEKIRAAYEAGCRRFDAAIGGLGGCPFAQDALVGNVATEVLLAELKMLGAELEPLRPLDGLLAASAEISRKYGERVQ